MSPLRYLLVFLIGFPLLLTPVFAAASILLFYRNDTAQRVLLGLRQPTGILYFGDSVLRSRSACDQDQRGIDDYLAEATGQRVVLIANAAYASRQYFELSGLIDMARHRPQAAVIGINLRSFGPTWADNPGFRHENDMRYVRALQGSLSSLLALAAGRVLDEATDDSWLDRPLQHAGVSYGTLREISERSVGPPLALECLPDSSRFAPQLRWKFLVQYLFAMQADNSELGFVVRSARRLQDLGVAPVLYLTPVNVQDAATLAGPEVADAMRANAALIVAALQREGLPVLDLSTALGPDFFADKGCACEHLRALGRRFVAEQIAAFIPRAKVGAPH